MRARYFHYLIVYKYLNKDGTTGNGTKFYKFPKKISSTEDIKHVRGWIERDHGYKTAIITSYKFVRASRG